MELDKRREFSIAKKTKKIIYLVIITSFILSCTSGYLFYRNIQLEKLIKENKVKEKSSLFELENKTDTTAEKLHNKTAEINNIKEKIVASLDKTLEKEFNPEDFAGNRIAFMREQPSYLSECIHSQAHNNVQIESDEKWIKLMTENIKEGVTLVSACKNTETNQYAGLYFDSKVNKKAPPSELVVFDQDFNEVGRAIVEEESEYLLHNKIGYIRSWFKDDHFQIDSDDKSYLVDMNTGQTQVVEETFVGTVVSGEETWQYNLDLTKYIYADFD